MKQSLLLQLFLFIAVLAFRQKQVIMDNHTIDSLHNASRKRVIGKPLPDFIAKSDKGDISNESLKGKVVFINLWELNCAPCMAEMPVLNELYDKLKNNKDFVFVSLTYEDDRIINEIKQKYNIHYAIYQTTRDECYMVNGLSAFPASLIVDRNGIAEKLYVGGFTDTIKVSNFMLRDKIYPAIIRELHLKQ